MNQARITPIVAGGLLLALAGCGGSSTRPTPAPGPWDYPASPRFAIALYSDAVTHAVGDSFDVKVVAYNLQSVFGVGLTVHYTPSLLAIGEIRYNPTLFVDDSSFIVLPLQDEPDSNRVGFGFTFVRGSHRSISGSAVVMRLRCLANAAGTAKFKLDPATLAIQDSTGNAITNYENLEIDSLSVTIH
jgi:hypothetical protein